VDPPNWDHTDVYVSTAGLSWQAEKSAGAEGATVIVLPEATRWLRDRIQASPHPLRLFVAARVGDRPSPYLTRRSA